MEREKRPPAWCQDSTQRAAEDRHRARRVIGKQHERPAFPSSPNRPERGDALSIANGEVDIGQLHGHPLGTRAAGVRHQHRLQRADGEVGRTAQASSPQELTVLRRWIGRVNGPTFPQPYLVEGPLGRFGLYVGDAAERVRTARGIQYDQNFREQRLHVGLAGFLGDQGRDFGFPLLEQALKPTKDFDTALHAETPPGRLCETSTRSSPCGWPRSTSQFSIESVLPDRRPPTRITVTAISRSFRSS